ncbi:biotin transporter BioY, partial [Bavariicoccus seileri]|uniref:biotin transporter BioY n=1 Tax=Bavariicoccus seileri TaxID=549685 RepID=UPI003F8DEBA5
MKTKDITQMALLIAIIIVLGMIPGIPLGFIPAPLILQNLGVMLAAILLTPKKTAITVGSFLLLALAGLPILSGGRGGYAVFIGPTGGYLVGFFVAAVLTSICLHQTRFQSLWYRGAIIWLFNVGLVNLLGIIWLVVQTNAPFSATFVSSLVFFPGDTIKAVIAVIVADRLQKYMRTTASVSQS